MRLALALPPRCVWAVLRKGDTMFLIVDGTGAGGQDRPSYYEKGVACGLDDVVEAHKWFNLAAMSGDERGAAARSGIAFDMTPREIAEAQRRARTYFRAQQQHQAA